MLLSLIGILIQKSFVWLCEHIFSPLPFC
jgi:hypothetical protein